MRKVTNRRDNVAAAFARNRRERPPTGSHTIPISAVAQNHAKDELLRSKATLLDAVVETVTGNVDAVVALTLTLVGTEQVAAAGAPVQVSVAVPVTPDPPMESVYMAATPAVTVAESEDPEGMPRPRFGEPEPVPVRATV
jgi:hypothetical protein